MREQPYRILAVAATPFFVDRGGHIHIYEPIKALQARGHQVTIVTYHIGRDLPGLDIRRIPNVPWYKKTDAGPSYHKPFLALLLLIKTLLVAREIKPDVLHVHGWDGVWAAWWASKLLRIPFIFDMQGSFSGEIVEHGYARRGSLYYRFLCQIERLSLYVSPVVVTSSTQIYNESRQRFHLSDSQIYPIFDGVDTAYFSPECHPPDPELRASLKLPDKPIIVFMGLLKTYQGVDDMVEAARIMVYELGFTDFHFLVLGFPDEDHYRQLAAEKGVVDYMTFTGKVPYDQTARYMALADLAIAPKISMTEGDAKIYFYMAMGLPVVAYERPASQEILGELGIYARYNDPADMGRVLRDVLHDKKLLEARGRANREKAVRDYSWDAVAERILEAYEKAIQRMRSSLHRQPADRPSPMHQFWGWFRLLMGVIGLAVLVTVVDVHEVREALSEADWLYLIPAWLLIMLATGVKTTRWMLLTQKKHLNISFKRLFGTYLIGTFYSQFLPGSSAGGDAMRMAESSFDTGRTVESVASVIIERAIGLVSIVATASLILTVHQPEGIPWAFTFTIDALTVGGITGLTILRLGWLIGTMARLLKSIGLGRIGRKVTELSQVLQGDLGEPRLLVSMIVLSLLANAFSMTSSYLVLLALAEPVSYFTFISISALLVTIEIIPLTPGSLGIREGAYVFFLGYLDVPEPSALSIGLLIRLLGWTQALLGGLILMQRGLDRRLPSVAPTESGGGS